MSELVELHEELERIIALAGKRGDQITQDELEFCAPLIVATKFTMPFALWSDVAKTMLMYLERRETMPDHDCPKNGCDRQCPPSKLACADHWADVPKHLQLAVYRTYRKWLVDPQPYFAARQAAIDAMNGVS